jgi:ATP-dependent DNA ligase
MLCLILPKGCVFDGELVVLDDAGRPLFNELHSAASSAKTLLVSIHACASRLSELRPRSSLCRRA